MKVDNLNINEFCNLMKSLCNCYDILYLIYKQLKRIRFDRKRIKFERAYNSYSCRYENIDHYMEDNTKYYPYLVIHSDNIMHIRPTINYHLNLKSAIYEFYDNYACWIQFNNKNKRLSKFDRIIISFLSPSIKKLNNKYV